MQVSLLQTSHEDAFLEPGWLLLLQFDKGYVPFRITGKEWSNLEPYALGPVGALGNLAVYDDVHDATAKRYLDPFDESLIYHSFFGVTPPRVRIFTQYPPQKDIGSMLNYPRIITGDVGYVDGDKSPFSGPFSRVTELFTVKERYPQYQAYNPLNDPMYNVMLAFDQRHYSYEVIKDKALIRDMLLGKVTAKRYTMGGSYSPGPMTLPDWLQRAVTDDILKYTLDVVGGKVK